MTDDAASRDVAPERARTRFWIYHGTVTLAGAALVVAVALMMSGRDVIAMGPSFYAVAALIVLGELRPLITAGTSDANGVTTSTGFVFALLLAFGAGPAILMQSVATLVADVLKRRAWWRTAFNIAQYALSFGAAGLVLRLLHVQASPTAPLDLQGRHLAAIGLAAVTYFVTNDALVAGILAIRNGSRVWDEFFDEFGYQVAANGTLLALAPIVVVVMQRSVWLVPLLLLPLFAVYATAWVSLEKERQSLHDSLTGLPNRKFLVERATAALTDARRSGSALGLFLLDLDRFKEVNDTLGHQVGDLLLQHVGGRLVGVLRPGDTVARLGGDEFAVLLPDVRDAAAALEVADRIHSALTEPFQLEGMCFDLEASIGVALHPDHGLDFDTLMQRADVAMYLAKDNRTGIEIYVADRDHNSTARLGLLGELRTALESGELELHYQPKVSLTTEDVVGVEALLRWRHPRRGMVAPDDFVPLAEQSGLMRLITHYVVETAAAQAAAWWRSGLRLQVAVNASVRDLLDGAFHDFVRDRLEAHGLPPRALLLEITEGVLMSDPARIARNLHALAQLGVDLSLDDFGTGYSSLVHVKRLPVREIKIDRSFVQRMDVNEEDAAIVRSIVDLGNAFGLRVVAEGVETRQAWDRLARLGCDLAQGWYLAKAMPAADATAWIAQHRARAALAVVPTQRFEADGLPA